LALVSTVAPLIVVVFSALPEDAAPVAALDGEWAARPELEDELPHPATISAAATTAAGVSQPIRRRCLPIPQAGGLQPRRDAGRTRSGQQVFCLVIAVLLCVQ